MFCRNCGTNVTDMKYCPKCGTPTTIANENPNMGSIGKSLKTNRKYVLAVLCTGIVLLGIAITSLLQKSSTETVSNSVERERNDETSNVNDSATELPNYAFAVDGYVEIQSSDIENVKVADYLPDRDMTLTYKDRNNLSTIYYVAPVPNEQKVEYRMTEELVNFDTYLGGEYTYDESRDTIVESVHGGGMNIYLIPLGKASPGDDVSYQVPPYLFTVRLDSGVYEDCVCMLREYSSTEKQMTIAIYYARGIGEVLVTTNFFSDNTNTFEVSDKLVSVENGILIEDSYISDNADDSADDRGNMVNCFFDGQRFECFETNSGEDMILTIYLFYNSDGNGNMISDIPSMYKGTLSNGKEFWFEPYESSQDSERYVINCDDGSVAYLEYRKDMSEINFLVENGMLYNYGGTYIGLPDSED